MNNIILENFESPPWEISLYKKIPIREYTPEAMEFIREIVGHPLRVKFRGPRPEKYNRSIISRRAGCLKEDAVTFTVYYRQT